MSDIREKIIGKTETARYKEMLRVAVPAVLEALFTVLVSTIDTKMISVLGSDYISAVSLTTSPKTFFLCVFFALGTTISVLVSHAVGEKDRDKGNDYFHSVLKITIILALITGIITGVFAEQIMGICNRQTSTQSISINFFRIVMGFIIFQTLSIVLNAALRGTGNTRITFISNIAYGLVDIFLNYLLIEGHWGFPRLAEKGDAIATVAGSAAACAISLCYVIKKSDFLSLKGFFNHKIFKNELQKQEITSKAANVVFENIFTRVGFLITSIIISTLPSEKTAVYFVGMILMNYSFSFGDGLQSAVVALAGRCAGAKDYDGMNRYINTGHVIGIICSVLLALIYILSADWFFGLYFDDAGMIGEGRLTSVIVGFITIVQIYRIIDIASLRVVGEMKIPRRIATACVLVLNPVTAMLFAQNLNMGVWGIWLSSTVTQLTWFAFAFYFSARYVRKKYVRR